MSKSERLICPVTGRPCTCPDYCNSNRQGSDILANDFKQALNDPCSTIKITRLGNLAAKYPRDSDERLLANAMRNQIQDDREEFFEPSSPQDT